MLLTVFLTAGFSLSVAQASAMSVRMSGAAAMPADPGMGEMAATPMKGDCNACLKDNGDKGRTMQCPAVCIAPALAVLPQDVAVARAPSVQQPSALPAPFLRGRSSLPDPYPPRPNT